jgi:uncharacterized protein
MYYFCVIKSSGMHTFIIKYLPQIVPLCEKHSVRRLFAFGSVTRSSFSEQKSDIDLYIEMMPMPAMERGEALIDLWDQFELVFDRPVDLITDQPLTNPYFKSELNKTKVLIYDREKQEIFI